MKKFNLIGILVLVLVSTKITAQSADTTSIAEINVFTTRGVNASGARYHVDGCRYLRNGQIKVDEKVALGRGLLPCSVCLPDRAAVLGQLRAEEPQEERRAYRKCTFKTRSGAKCERPAEKDSRYCELHESRESKR